MKIYCIECNSPTEYSDVKPNFCAFCQHPFNSSTAAKPKKRQINSLRKRKSKKYEEEEEYEDDEEFLKSKFDVDRIEIEPIMASLRGREKLSDVACGQKSSDSPKLKRAKGKKISKKKFSEQWKSELTDKSSREIGGR